MNLTTGRFGYSFHHHRSVGSLIGEHLRRTLRILAPALLFSTLAAALLGTLAGWMRGSPLDWTVTALALPGLAMPTFLTATVFLDLFGFRLQWFPLSGFAPPPVDDVSGWQALTGQVSHLVLSVGVLTLASAAAKVLVMRNTVARARDDAYVLYARAKGVATWRVVFAHIFRNACLPLLHLVALHLGFIVSGAVLVEVVFSIDGMGALIHEAALHRDYPVLQGAFLVLTLVVMGCNLLVDVLSSLVDPRIRP